MERSAWTDERLDDMVASTNTQIERLWMEIRDLRTEMREMRVEMREMGVQLQTEMHAGFQSIRRDMFHGAIALFGSQAALFAVLVVRAL
jgi:hypothetical protein